ncbi:MAG: Fic family protein [Propionibacteriaceae bacterium]|nr:Fic family protein [Propionibacteriaceae bacterium]
MTKADLTAIIRSSLLRHEDLIGQAAALFVALAAAQPFMDGNKRTALFVAEGYLLHHRSDQLLSLPTRDQSSGQEAVRHFNDLLARAYIFGEVAEAEEFLASYRINLLSGSQATES